MQLIGQTVYHKVRGRKSRGKGTIINVLHEDIEKIVVQFSAETVTFAYPEAFGTSLTFEDSVLQEEVLTCLQKKNDEKEAAELKKKLEWEQKEAEKKAAAKRAESEKLPYLIDRTTDGIFTFYCAQSDYYDREKDQGIIWAPLYDMGGHSQYSWDNLLNVRPGDVIFHASEGMIRAISRAKGLCYDKGNPFPEENVPNYQYGRAVDCDYTFLQNPIPTADYKEVILKYAQQKYSPFDKNGDGSGGYLCYLKKELASVFLREIIKDNPDVAELNYVQWLLEPDSD